MPFRPLTPKEQGWWEKAQPCLSPEHDPPRHMVYPPGLSVWVCPACGQETRIVGPPTILCTAHTEG
jgi:hypothetical protein